MELAVGASRMESVQGWAGCSPDVVRPIREVRGVYDQRVTLPASTGIAKPLPNLRRKMRSTVERDHTRVVDHLLVDEDGLGGLHDLDVGVVVDFRPAVREHWRPLLRPDDAAFQSRPHLRPL